MGEEKEEIDGEGGGRREGGRGRWVDDASPVSVGDGGGWRKRGDLDFDHIGLKIYIM